jgi:hypothetical protein
MPPPDSNPGDLLLKAVEAAIELTDLDAEREKVVARRDQAIAQAVEYGLTTRVVAQATGLTHGRVQQIVNEHREKIAATKKALKQLAEQRAKRRQGGALSEYLRQLDAQMYAIRQRQLAPVRKATERQHETVRRMLKANQDAIERSTRKVQRTIDTSAVRKTRG